MKKHYRLLHHPDDYDPVLSPTYRKALAVGDNMLTGLAIGAVVGLLVLATFLYLYFHP